jgi:hypothetical protein
VSEEEQQAGQGDGSAGKLWPQLDRASKLAEKLDSIATLIGKAAVFVGAPLVAAHGWLREQVPVIPGKTLVALIAVIAVTGLVCALLAYRARAKHWLHRGALAVVGGLGIATSGVLVALKPDPPRWQRIDVPQLLREPGLRYDLPIIVMRDELLGRNDLMPGGETYRNLLGRQSSGERLLEQWAGYYAPVLFPSTLPKRVSLRETPAISPRNASIGVLLLTWSTDGEEIRVSTPQGFGYKSLQGSVSVTATLKAKERAAMMVFVFPWTAEASAGLDAKFDELIAIE